MVGGQLGVLWDLKESSPSLCVSRILSCCSVRSTAQPRTAKIRVMAVPGQGSQQLEPETRGKNVNIRFTVGNLSPLSW